jgi:hypothetical protein
MKYWRILFFLCSVLILLITSCAEKGERGSMMIAAEDTVRALIIGDPCDIGFNNLLLFPVGTNYKPIIHEPAVDRTLISNNQLSFVLNGASNKFDRLASAEFINSDAENYDIRNVLFYDLIKGVYKRLTTDTLHILSFSVHKEFSRPQVFYRAVRTDYNQDGQYDMHDAVILFRSNIDGSEFVPLTPDNQSFNDYFYYPAQNRILIKTLVDIDNDGSFTLVDETNFLSVDLMIFEPGRDLFSVSLRDSLRAEIRN